MLRCTAVLYKSAPDNTDVCVSGVVYVIWARGLGPNGQLRAPFTRARRCPGFLRLPPRDVVGQANRIERCDRVITGYPKLLGLPRLPATDGTRETDVGMIGNADCPSGGSSLQARNALVLAAGRGDGDGDQDAPLSTVCSGGRRLGRKSIASR